VAAGVRVLPVALPGAGAVLDDTREATRGHTDS
jgi:hypothetical protein